MQFTAQSRKFAAYFKNGRMLIFNRQADLSQTLAPYRHDGQKVGFVPTMGALHDGHLSLLQRSLTENQVTVISLFVNPTQFNNPEDLAKYPRTLERDVEKIRSLDPGIIVFAPEVDEMYGGQTQSSHFDFDGLENQMEGQFRPGHFDGVGTIVKKLFEIVQPNRAYFGEKDFQQLQIVRVMTRKENLPVEVVGCPIFREANGLAMSSRNERLDPQIRDKASVIYQTLLEVQKRFGAVPIADINAFVTSAFQNLPPFELEYFTIADAETLQTAQHIQPGKTYRAFIAVFANNVRLIDTISLN